MFKSIGKTLLTGFITLLPVVLTIYLLYWLATSSERVMGNLLHLLLPTTLYFPGLGMIAGLVIVFIVGLLMKAYLVRQLFALWEKLLYQLPLVNGVYRALRDLFDFFSHKQKGFGKVVTVSIGNLEAIGFITLEDTARMPDSFKDRDCVLVYLPMSYMIGGHTVLVPRANIRECKMSMDEALRFVLTAGIAGKKQN
jgi:uncharacterized membrane protein